MEYYDQITNWMATHFINMSNPIDNDHWYLPAHIHASDFILVNSLCLFTLFVGSKTMKKVEFNVGVSPSHWTNKILAVVLAINVLLNIVYKIMKGYRYIVFMLQPCHIVSSIFVYLLSTSNLKRASFIHHFTLYYIIVTISALAFPDTGDLIRPGEFTNFFVQHWAMVIAPILLQVTRFKAKFAWSYAFVSAASILMAHFSLFLLVSLLTGVNINYMLSPPPTGFEIEPLIIAVSYGYWGRRAYRPIIATLIIVLSWIFGYLVILVGNTISKLFTKSSSNTKNNQNVKKKIN